MIRAIAIGWKAAEALQRSEGTANVMAALRTSSYLVAAGEIVWLGGPGAPLHPRAVLTDTSLSTTSATVRVHASHLLPWRPTPIAVTPATRAAAQAIGRILVMRLSELGEPEGFGPLLLGRRLPFPLDGAGASAIALARACSEDRPADVVAAAEPLLGLGPGLTPSGDDLVGGALFAQIILAEAAPDWQVAGGAVVARARTRTHPISVALLADLAAGHAWAPMHDLAAAMASGARDVERSLGAARRLVGIGHTSGWDLLAGVLLSLGSSPLDAAS